MNSRIQRIRSILKEKKLEALLITNRINISYLTGLPLTDSCLLLTRNKNIILTDFRYMCEAETLKDFILEKVAISVVDTVVSLIKKLNLKKIGFEGEWLPYNTYITMRRGLKGVVLVNTKGITEGVRMTKGPEELKTIKEAIRISKAAFFYIKKTLKEGISEKELAKRIDIYIRSHGSDGVAFPTIVAGGPNSAKPHAIPTTRRIRRNEPVIIDFGASVGGYNSDLTRTLYLGKINSKFSHIYNIVRDAQECAISFIKPGRIISEVDRSARSVINKAGFGEHFGHAVGHGIGREVHESPKIFRAAKTALLPNMVLTIEPAIYIPRWGGIRIEDMVVVTKNGCEVLTSDINKSI